MPQDISVLMGILYRQENIGMLERSVRSILDQSIKNLELVICDDGSSTKASDFLERLAHEDTRIRFVRRGNLLSLPSKLNACLEQASGTWIARMDDDDYSHPHRLEFQINYLRSHSEIAFVGCNVNIFQLGEYLGVRSFPEFPVVRDFYFSQPFIHPALVFRKEVLLAVGGYCEGKHCIRCEDYDLLLRLYHEGFRGANLQKPLFDYTIADTAKGKSRMIHRWNEVLTRYKRFLDLGELPRALPYVVKPLAVGLIPEAILKILKRKP